MKKWFIACRWHLGEFPIYTLFGMLCVLAQLPPSQMRQLTLQVSIRQVHSLPVCHGNSIKYASHCSENLSINRFFVKSPFPFVAPKPRYSLICFGLGWIFVIASLWYHCTGVIVFLALLYDKSFYSLTMVPNLWWLLLRNIWQWQLVIKKVSNFIHT